MPQPNEAQVDFDNAVRVLGRGRRALELLQAAEKLLLEEECERIVLQRGDTQRKFCVELENEAGRVRGRKDSSLLEALGCCYGAIKPEAKAARVECSDCGGKGWRLDGAGCRAHCWVCDGAGTVEVRMAERTQPEDAPEDHCLPTEAEFAAMRESKRFEWLQQHSELTVAKKAVAQTEQALLLACNDKAEFAIPECPHTLHHFCPLYPEECRGGPDPDPDGYYGMTRCWRAYYMNEAEKKLRREEATE